MTPDRNFTYACGCAGYVSGGSNSDVRYQIKRYSAEQYDDCKKKSIAEAARLQAAELGLPALTGVSAKQVEYGEIKRYHYIRHAEQEVAAEERRLVEKYPDQAQAIRDGLALLRARCHAQTSAAAWIEGKIDGGYDGSLGYRLREMGALAVTS